MAERPKTVEESASQGRSKPVSFEDDHWVAKVQGGQTEVYGKLVRKYQDRVFNTCWRICGNLEDARDLTQDAFLKGLERITDFRRKSGFYTWIFRIAVNLAISHRRKAKGRRTASLDWADSTAGTQAAALAKRVHDSHAESPVDSVTATELQGKIAAGLQELDDDHRAVVVLRDIEGFDYREIAEILDVPTGTVKSRLHRGRMALREAILPYFEKH